MVSGPPVGGRHGDGDAEEPSQATSHRIFGVARSALLAGVVGVLLTACVSGTAVYLDRRNNHRLLQLQTQQDGVLLSASIVKITGPLAAALEVAEATRGDAASFGRYIATVTGPAKTFVSAALVRVTAGGGTVVASVGAGGALSGGRAAVQATIAAAGRTPTFAVTQLHRGSGERVGYAVGGPADGYVVYAERAIPADREVAIEHDSAFSDLNYATYIGAPSAADLATTDVSPSQLPLTGHTATLRVPFGDTTLTLVARANTDLAGTFEAVLPYLLLGVGLVTTGAAALAAGQLERRRRRAELHGATLSRLYQELDDLYSQQRSVAEALQQALLPAFLPRIDGIDLASRYVAGVAGVDVGGDWFSVIQLGDGRFGFVVGDVSGRGIGAAAVMARIRFTLRAYLYEGHSPDVVLSMCSAQLDLERDEHFATAVVGIGDPTTGTVVLANAGHPQPLLIGDGRSEFVATSAGLPLGMGADTYELCTVSLEPGDCLLAYTDGLVERRNEDIDVGLGRLAAAAQRPAPDLEAVVSSLVEAMSEDGGEDDIAVLAIRRQPRDASPTATPSGSTGVVSTSPSPYAPPSTGPIPGAG
jgi:serine phosphatase RsbU (regulator of sigma subunit)